MYVAMSGAKFGHMRYPMYVVTCVEMLGHVCYCEVVVSCTING